MADDTAALAAAQKDEAAKKTAADNAQAQVGKGTPGFFTAEGDASAAKTAVAPLTVNGTTYQNQASDAGDSTSIDNLKAAIQLVEAANKIRQANGLGALKVTIPLTAVTEQRMAYSQEVFGHAPSDTVLKDANLTSWGENLAGASSAQQAVDAWYAEKKVVDAANAAGIVRSKYASDSDYQKAVNNYGAAHTISTVVDGMTYVLNGAGHYFSLMSSTYTVAGGAYSSSSSRYLLDFGTTAGSSMTTSELSAKLDSYLGNSQKALDDYKAAQAATKAAQDELAADQKKAADAQTDLTNAQTAQTQAQSAYDQAVQASKDAQTKLAAAQSDKTDSDNLIAAKAAKTAADNQVAMKQAALDTAAKDLADAQAAQTAADKQVTDDQQAVDAAQKKLSDLQNARKNLTDAQKAVADDEAAQKAASQAADDAAKNLADAQAKQDEAQKAYATAADAAAAAQKKLDADSAALAAS